MEVLFDDFAASYDTDFTQTAVGKLQRDRVWQYLRAALAPEQQILELNCGTGVDAFWLSAAGHEVLATDISAEMIRQCEARLSQSNADSMPGFRRMAVQELTQHLDDQRYDLLFSNFGGLNCLQSQELVDFGTTACSLLKPGGRLIAVVMPEACWWEQLYFTGRMQWGKAWRRWRGEADFALPSGEYAKIWYYSPRHFMRLLGKHFTLRAIRPIGFYVPPSYMDHWFQKYPGWLHWLGQQEQKLDNSAWKARFADHFLIDLELSTHQ